MASLSKHELKRQEKIFELINTEEEYLTDLSMVIEVTTENIPLCF